MSKKAIVPKLTRRTGIPASTIYNILRGVRRPSWSKAESLSRQTNQEPGFFMALKDIGADERVKRLAKLELLPAKLPPPPEYRPAKTRSP
jgi:transcriptional regulator with XRE-family HTH domain